MELHLSYCQAKSLIIQDSHPCTKEQAVQFAAFQAQVAHGNYNSDLHKPGWLILKDFFSENYRSKDMEHKLLDGWNKLHGMNDRDARFRYIQECRSLKTYGMSLFNVKCKVPNKKKFMDALLGISKKAIVVWDENNNPIKEHPMHHLQRWAANPETMNLDFGVHETDIEVLATNDGDSIADLLSGYIDLLVKKKKMDEESVHQTEF